MQKSKSKGQHGDAETHRFICGPARDRDFDDARVANNPLLRIEVRLFPRRDELGIADGVAPRGALDIDRITDGRPAASIASDLAAVRDDDVVDFLVEVALGVHPALGDPDAVEVSAQRVFQGGDEE